MSDLKNLIDFSIINIDKPTGPTSYSVTNYVRKELKINKASHLGTLDPQVTGVLPIALGRACKLSTWLMRKEKTYVGIMRLHKEIEKDKLEKQMEDFIGKITQLPPIKSSVRRAERTREIKTFKILEIEGQDVLFETSVEAGTYIRKLVHDLGEKIGGAHMLELRRTKAGMFDEKKISTLYEFDKAVQAYKNGNPGLLRNMLVSGEEALAKFTRLDVKKESLMKCLKGSPIFQDYLADNKKFKTGEVVTVFCKDRFVGCYTIVNKGTRIANPEFVAS